MSEQTVGVLGTGRIGRAAIKLFKGLGASVIAYDKYPQKKRLMNRLYMSRVLTIYIIKAILSAFICPQLKPITTNLIMKCLSR